MASKIIFEVDAWADSFSIRRIVDIIIEETDAKEVKVSLSNDTIYDKKEFEDYYG